MRYVFLFLLSFCFVTTHIQTMEKYCVQDSNTRLLDREAPFFENITERLLDREKHELKDYLCDQVFQSDYRRAALIKSRSNASQNKDIVEITQTAQAGDNRCTIHVKIIFADIYAEQNQNICIVKQIPYPEFIEIMDRIKKSSDSCCCCCSIQ